MKLLNVIWQLVVIRILKNVSVKISEKQFKDINQSLSPTHRRDLDASWSWAGSLRQLSVHEVQPGGAVFGDSGGPKAFRISAGQRPVPVEDRERPGWGPGRLSHPGQGPISRVCHRVWGSISRIWVNYILFRYFSYLLIHRGNRFRTSVWSGKFAKSMFLIFEQPRKSMYNIY